MTTKNKANNVNTSESVQNDWNDDDDNWDDWGDAEDNFPPNVAEDSKIDKQPVIRESEHTLKDVGKDVGKRISSEDLNSNVNTLLEQQSSQNQFVNTWEGVWKPWGMVSSVLSTATEGLGNITSTVGQGINQVIGVPDPEEMARINANETAKTSTTKEENGKSSASVEEENAQQSSPAFGLSLVSGVTTLGSKVINTGLDTLEGIGKKTMTILQENDPLLMNKRKMLGLESNKPNLSEILQEAKKDADQIENTLKEMKIERSKELLRFDILFENNCGLVHLEALEILSKESNLKLQTLLESVAGKALTEFEETINEVKELLEMEELDGESDGDYDCDALNEKLLNAIEDVDIQITFDDIVNKWSNITQWIEDSGAIDSEDEIFAKGITSLAETCALEMNKLHKTAELLLVKEHHSTANEVDCIVTMCKHFNTHLNGLTNRFAATLNGKDNAKAKAHISTLFGEMLQATQHIEKAFKLFLPILQIGAV